MLAASFETWKTTFLVVLNLLSLPPWEYGGEVVAVMIMMTMTMTLMLMPAASSSSVYWALAVSPAYDAGALAVFIHLIFQQPSERGTIITPIL